MNRFYLKTDINSSEISDITYKSNLMKGNIFKDGILYIRFDSDAPKNSEILGFSNTTNLISLIKKCEFCQTKEMVDFYKSLNPKYYNVSWLIFNCKFCQTQEMYEYLETLRSKM